MRVPNVIQPCVRAFMEVVWENLIRLFEDMVIITLFFECKQGYVLFHGSVGPPGSPISPWRVTTHEEYKTATSKPGWKLLE